MGDMTIVFTSGAISLLVTLITLLLSVGSYKNKIDNLEKNVDRILNKIESLIERIAKLEAGIDRDREHSKFIQRKSPLSLTDKGKALLLDSHGKDFIDNNRDFLIKEIKKHKPRTAYDVQELSKKVIEDNVNDDKFIPIKDFAYKDGRDLRDINEVLGIYLRDLALPVLGFNITDIHD